jgi:integrase
MLPRGATPTHTLSASPAAWEYNATTRGLFRDLRRHLEWAWAQYAGADPFAGDVWQVALLDLRINASRRWPATHGVIDFRSVEPRWLREIVKDWARSNRPYVQRLRETLRACQTASHTLTAAGRTDPAGLGAGDFTRILDAISGQRRADGSLYSASHRNLMLYQFCQVIEHGRAAGLMAAVPDPFRPTRRHRVREDPNEDELGKALPETVIGQLDAHLHLLGPAGRAGAITPADLQLMHQTIYRILRDTGRRPGEVVSLRVGCIEVIDGQHNLIYDNHKAGRMRRRLPITTDTAKVITTWQQRRTRLSAPPALDSWLFPSPLLRAQQSRGHVTPDCVGRTFKAWVAQIGTIDSELLGPDGTPAPFDPALITPYALRHTYAQRHADAGVPVDVLKELMGHVAVATTMGHYRVGLKRKQQAIYSVGSLAASSRPAEKTDCTINSGPGPGDRLLDEHPAGGEGTRLLKRRGRRPDLVATSHALHPGAGGADGRLEERRPAHAPDQPAASRATQLEGRRSPAARSVWSAASLSCTR